MANVFPVTDYVVINTFITTYNLISDQFLPRSVAQFCGQTEKPEKAALTLIDGSVPRAAVPVYWAPLGPERSC